jgi:hypothetical protein
LSWQQFVAQWLRKNLGQHDAGARVIALGPDAVAALLKYLFHYGCPFIANLFSPNS